jgi:hypothetical protein
VLGGQAALQLLDLGQREELPVEAQGAAGLEVLQEPVEMFRRMGYHEPV